MSLKEELKKFITSGEVRNHRNRKDGVHFIHPYYLDDATEEQIDGYVETICIFDTFLEDSGLRNLCGPCHKCCPEGCIGYSAQPLLCRNPICLLHLCYRLDVAIFSEEQRVRMEMLGSMAKQLLPRHLPDGAKFEVPPKQMLAYLEKELKQIAPGIKRKIGNVRSMFIPPENGEIMRMSSNG